MSRFNSSCTSGTLALTLACLAAGLGACSEATQEGGQQALSPLDEPFPNSTRAPYQPRWTDFSGNTSPDKVSSTQKSSAIPETGDKSLTPGSTAPGPTTQESQSPSSVESSSSPEASSSSSSSTIGSVTEDTGSNSGATGSSNEDSGSTADTTGSESGTTSAGSDESSSDSGTSSSGPDTSSGSEPTGTEPAPEIPVDPQGPVFGFELQLTLPAPAVPGESLRAIIFDLSAQIVNRPGKPDPDLELVRIWDYQPRLVLNEAQQGAIILPTPDNELINPSTNRSAPVGIAIYRDDNGDRQWNPDESFVAALPKLLTYVAPQGDKVERWAQFAKLLGMGETWAVLEAVQQLQPLKRLDEERALPSLRGKLSEVDPAVGFITSVTPFESANLAENLLPGSRGPDLYLRGELQQEWSLQHQEPPSALRRIAEPIVEIPGINSDYLHTEWLSGYSRPVDAPLEAGKGYLTSDSQLRSGLCDGRGGGDRVSAIWIDPGNWASSPLGAIYAAWADLGVGWGYAVVGYRSPQSLQARKSALVPLVVQPGPCGR